MKHGGINGIEQDRTILNIFEFEVSFNLTIFDCAHTI